ncbi:MAG: hypothetical protein LBL95_09605, partial [Deltaproteobacteria bacterium]|nr:hypothetical protein [Deltaproteobacteria bacterium]
NTPGSGRLSVLSGEFKELEAKGGTEGGPQAPSDETPAAGPMSLEAIMSLGATARIGAMVPLLESEGQKAALASLLDDFAGFDQLKAADLASQAESGFHAVLYAAYGIRDTSLRRVRVHDSIRREESLIEHKEKALGLTGSKAERAAIAEEVAQSRGRVAELEGAMAELEVAMARQFAYYKASLQNLSGLDVELLAREVNAASESFKGQDSYSRGMSNALNVVKRDIGDILSNRGHLITLEAVAVPLPK